MKARDEGAALIAVLMMVVIMAALAALVVDAAGFSLRRTANQAQMDQNAWYLRGAEAYASSRIQFLNSVSPNAPRLDQADWQGKAFTFPLDDGVLSVTLWDGGNCFNLNALVVREEESDALRASPLGRVVFARLLDALRLRADSGINLATAASDWIDSDAMPDVGGAEAPAYETGPGAYRPGDTLMADVSELRRVRGITTDIADALSPFVCVRPTPAFNTLNVNTLREDQAALLAITLNQNMSVQIAQDIIRSRPRGGWDTIDAFFSQPLVSGLDVNEPTRALFSVETHYYVAMTRVRRGEATESCAALLDARMPGSILRRICGVGGAERLL